MNLEWLGMTLFRRLRPSCAKASNHRTFLQLLGASSRPSDPHGHLPQWKCRGLKSNTSLFHPSDCERAVQRFLTKHAKLVAIGWNHLVPGERWALQTQTNWDWPRTAPRSHIGSEPWWVELVEPVEPARKRQLHRHRSSPPRQPRKVNV